MKIDIRSNTKQCPKCMYQIPLIKKKKVFSGEKTEGKNFFFKKKKANIVLLSKVILFQ